MRAEDIPECVEIIATHPTNGPLYAPGSDAWATHAGGHSQLRLLSQSHPPQGAAQEHAALCGRSANKRCRTGTAWADCA